MRRDSRPEHGRSRTGTPRVLMVSGEYPPTVGGVGDYTARLAAALGAQGIEVGVLTSGHEGLRCDPTAVRPAAVSCSVSGWGLAAYPRVLATARAWQADLVHLQYQAGAYELSAAVPLLPAWLRLRGQRVGVTFHDLRPPYLFPKAGRLRDLSLRLMAHTAHGVVCTELADLRRLGVGLGRVHVPLGSNIACTPPAGYDQRGWRRARGLAEDRPLVGFFGFLNASKGADTLLRALARLPEAHLALVGAEAGSLNPADRAEAQRVRSIEAQLGLGGRVWRSGALAPTEVSAALLACDVVALPFRDGASGRRGSLLAALAHGRAIVTTRGPDDALLRDGESAVLVEPEDAAALAAALQRVVADAPLRARLEAGALRLARRFDWDEIARAHARWYRNLLSSAARGRRGADV